MSLLWSRYSIGYRRGAGAHGLRQGIKHLVMELKSRSSYNAQYNIRTIGTFSGREDCFSIVLIPLAQIQKQQ